MIAEGYEVILINSNPATIMTDPESSPIAPMLSRLSLAYATEVIPWQRTSGCDSLHRRRTRRG